MYELAFCFECACFFGQLQCRVKGTSDKEKPTKKMKYDEIDKNCKGKEECSNLTLDDDVKKCKYSRIVEYVIKQPCVSAPVKSTLLDEMIQPEILFHFKMITLTKKKTLTFIKHHNI